jgi:PASTA domain
VESCLGLGEYLYGMRSLFVSVVATIVFGASALSSTALAADSSAISAYGGDMQFPLIHGPSDPEDYSWEVILGKNQSLESVDAQGVKVVNEGGVTLMTIEAERAHDANGTTVPTSLAFSDGNVITLTVHHRAGNPVEDGAPFVYPVGAGAGFELGFESVTTYFPSEDPGPSGAPGPSLPENCVVPRLSRRSLKASKRRLRESGCQIGEARKRRGATAKAGKVVAQNPRPGTVLAPGARVSVTLGI